MINNWPILRDAQQQVCREVPACYLVVTMNCGEEFNIHPQNKKNSRSSYFLANQRTFL